jgi:hypothetical protein
MWKFSAPRLRALGTTWVLAGLLGSCAAQPEQPRSAASRANVRTRGPAAVKDTQAVEERDAVFLLGLESRRAKFRAFAHDRKSELLTIEGLRQLAWLGDDSGVDAAIMQLSNPQAEVVEVSALALAEHAPQNSTAGKTALFAAFQQAEPRSRPALAWALAVLGERRALEPILELYQRRQLQPVQRLDGGPAFDIEPLSELLDQQRGADLARSPSPELRRVAATKLAQDPERNAALLSALLLDGDLEAARRAAGGVARIAEARRREILKKGLAGAMPSRRGIYLDGLMRGGGVEAALSLLAAAEGEGEDQRALLAEMVFQVIRMWADPRGGDALMRFIDSKPHAHWETQAALALAEIGDLRAVAPLANRLSIDPLKGYDASIAWQARYAKDDLVRVQAARALADLAELNPKSRAQIRQQSETALLTWAKLSPLPHANALSALSALESEAGIEQLRRWADPRLPLPAPGAAPPLPEAWSIAESALRQLGRATKSAAFALFEKQLKRRPKNLDASPAGLADGRHAVLGMALRTLGTGAADGVSGSGDARASELLMALIAEPREHEDVRHAACHALVWVASAERAADIGARIGNLRDTSAPARFSRVCLLQALAERVPPGVEPALLALITPAVNVELQIAAGRALGKRGLTADLQKTLLDRVEDSRTLSGAGLALLLGGDADAATRAVAVVAARSPALRDDLAREWKNTLGAVSALDVEEGHLLRWVANARAAALVASDTSRLSVFKEILAEKLGGQLSNAGPHSLSRTVLRVRLWRLATDNQASRAEALEALALMKERGSLAALATQSDPLGKRARRALFDVDHPRQGAAL